MQAKVQPREWKKWAPIKPLIESEEHKKGRRLTTIVMGFQCKDGAVLATDLKAGRGDGMTNLSMTKPLVVSDTGMVAFTTQEFAWVSEFMTILGHTSAKKSDFVRVGESVTKYGQLVFRRYPKGWPPEVDIEGVLATCKAKPAYEGEPMLFRFGFNKPPHPLLDYDRILIGEAAAIATAETYIRVIEYAGMKLYGGEGGLVWRHLSTFLVTNLCDVILTLLPAHVQSVQGACLFVIHRGERPAICGIDDKPGAFDNKVKSFVSSFIEEVGIGRILKTAMDYEFIPSSLRQSIPKEFLDSFGSSQ